jgi:hypothetical protein
MMGDDVLQHKKEGVGGDKEGRKRGNGWIKGRQRVD